MENIRTAPIVSPDEFLARATSWFIDRGLSIALWKLPGSNVFHIAASDRARLIKDVTLEDSEPGFIFAPFQPTSQKIFLPTDELFVLDGTTLLHAVGSALSEVPMHAQPGKKSRYHSRIHGAITDVEKSLFIRVVEEAQREISNGSFEKVVASRQKTIDLPENFILTDSFLKTCRTYPNAMVSVFSSPMTGTWMGATPELLVSVDRDQHFRTVAVAGTQAVAEGVDLRSVTWTQKEIEEQALVERYIISCFKKIRLREFDEHGPKTVKAGNVLHLRTEFDVDMVATNFPQLGTVMLNLLHPTSAVCGMPMEPSLDFLRKHEGYDREFYSGYLGPVNVLQESHLFVNLRCMQLFSSQGRLYAGAGIMADSDPEVEWLETELKFDTLLKVIRE